MLSSEPPEVIVYPPIDSHRNVTVRGCYAGAAHRMADLLDILRRSGVDCDQIELTDPAVVEWRGGGPEVWE
ncbi:hypothetical protein OG937_45700 [Streptomyces sp. NBC_00510]